MTLHLPVLEATRNLINKDLIDSFKRGATLINLSREKVAMLHLKKIGVNLTQLTKEQADYIGVSQSGPYKADHYRY